MYSCLQKFATLFVNARSYDTTESTWWLLAKTCPLLVSVKLCTDLSERQAKNFLAELVPLKHLVSIEIHSACLPAVLWYFERAGTQLRNIALYSYGGYSRNFVFSDAVLAKISYCCPQLAALRLHFDYFQAGGFDSTNQDAISSPIFPNLEYMSGQFVSITITSLIYLLSPKNLKSVEIGILEPFHADDYAELLKAPFFKSVVSFISESKFFSNVNDLERLLFAAPKLKYVSYKFPNGRDDVYIDELVKKNNWDLGELYHNNELCLLPSCQYETSDADSLHYCMFKRRKLEKLIGYHLT